MPVQNLGDHPERARQLQDLGIRSLGRYTRTEAEADLDIAIQQLQESLILMSDSLERANLLQNLGRGYQNRYRNRYSREAEADLDIAIQYCQESLELTPDSHLERADRLEDLAIGYHDRYKRGGAEADLDIAIQQLQESLKLMPDGYLKQASLLQDLGSLYGNRYLRRGVEVDLITSIQYLQRSQELTPDSDPERAGLLQDLGSGYLERYHRLGAKSDIIIAIQDLQEALEATPDNHPERARRLQFLGQGYYTKYLGTRAEADLNISVQYLQKSLKLIPDIHPERAGLLQSLGVGYREKYQKRRVEADLSIAIQYFEESLELTPNSYLEQAHRLQLLALGYYERYLRRGAKTDLDIAIQRLQESLNHYSSRTLDRLKSGIRLTRLLAEDKTWPLAYQATSTTISLITLLTPRFLEISDKQHLLAEVVGLASDAAAIALMAEKSPYEAIRLLELGRGIIITSLNELRVDLSELERKHPQLAEDYISLRNQLDVPRALIDMPPSFTNSADQRHNAGQKLEEIIKDIRSLSGFSRFLMAPTEDELKAAAATGPIVIINVSDYRCDALVVERHRLQAIELPHLYSAEVRAWAATLANPDLLDTSLLKWLWDTIAKPVLETLGFTKTPSDSWPRIWWIPTGPLTKFPIHAAGSRDSSVLDRVISSYSTSIRALIQSRQRRSEAEVVSEEGKAVLVGMERTPDHNHLPYVPQEIEMLSRLCGSTKLQVKRPQTHRSDVLLALQDCRIFHFAGHGLTDQEDASKSSLILSDGPLAVASLLKLNLHNRAPFLAYLSACGTGEVKQDSIIDEALHLISACQLAGFQHVIGTLWKVKDQTCVEAAAKTYDWMIKGNMSDDSVAEGLHRASRYLRAQWVSESVARTVARASERMAAIYNEDGLPMTEQARSSQGTAGETRTVELYEDPPLYWAPYVHFGI